MMDLLTKYQQNVKRKIQKNRSGPNPGSSGPNPVSSGPPTIPLSNISFDIEEDPFTLSTNIGIRVLDNDRVYETRRSIPNEIRDNAEIHRRIMEQLINDIEERLGREIQRELERELIEVRSGGGNLITRFSSPW